MQTKATQTDTHQHWAALQRGDTCHKVKEVAELLKVRQHQVLSLIRNGQLRAIDVSQTRGGRPRWRIMSEDLDGFIAGRTHEAAAPRRRRKKRKDVKEFV